MPIPVTRYKCEHCHKKVYASKYAIRDHEKLCLYNPVNKSCSTCNNRFGNYCDKLSRDIFLRGEKIFNCPLWEERTEEYE
jgi:NAD-dependent SIR2 family protein deacetylase